ncbi:transmembrane secretion effector family protein, partial [Vibrio parahaemolyticus V-223/04]
LTAWTKPN